MSATTAADEGVSPRAGARWAEAATRTWARLTELLSSDRIGPTLLMALVMTVISWPLTSLVPQAGVDGSWQAGLAMAFEHHIQWGSHVNFTYGPLGFLVVPTLYFGRTAFLSLTYLGLSRWVLFTLLIKSARPKFPRYWALPVAYVVGATAVALVDSADLLMACALLLAVVATRSSSEANATWATSAVAAIAAVGFLLKFSVGLLALGMTVLAVAGRPRWRRHVLPAIGVFGVTLVVLWVGTGNTVTNLALYFRMSTYIADGYAGTMSVETGRDNEWYYAATVLVFLFFCVAVSLAPTGKRTRLCATVLFAWYAWLTLKEGFVRHDGHDLIFFGLILVAFLAVPWPEHKAMAQLGGGLSLAVVLAWVSAGGVPANLVSLVSNARGVASNFHTVLSSTDRNEVLTSARSALQAGYGLPASLTDRLNGQTVAIEPCEVTIAWAFDGMTWDPEPVLQQYTAYEAALDQEESSFLRSTSAPRYILNLPAAECSASEDPYFMAPTAQLTTLCHYEQLEASNDWQLLVRVANRCGRLVAIRTMNVGFGSAVTVPTVPPGDAVVASFRGVGSSLVYRAENFLLKAAAIEMQTPGGDYRFVAATAGDLHVLSAPSALGYTASFSPPPISSFSITERDIFSNTGTYRVTFYEMSVKPPKS